MVSLLGLTSLGNAQTIDISNPRFYSDVNGTNLRKIMNVSFGWFKTLDQEQKEAYYSSIVLALKEGQPDQPVGVRWYRNDASGVTRVVWQENRTAGFCKRLHISVIAYDMLKNIQTTACFNEVDNRWTWYE